MKKKTKKDKDPNRIACEKAVRAAYKNMTSLNDVASRYGNSLVNEFCDKAEAEKWEGT